MNWLNFFITLAAIANFVGAFILLYHVVDYATWTIKSNHKTQRNWIIAGLCAYALESAVIVGITTAK